jgi:membrane protein DedA with SNARE-associated domain
LSHDGKIAIASSISIAVSASILFSTLGYLCGLYRQKKQLLKQKSPNKLTPVYEDVLPKEENEQKLELKSNIAYAPVKQL